MGGLNTTQRVPEVVVVSLSYDNTQKIRVAKSDLNSTDAYIATKKLAPKRVNNDKSDFATKHRKFQINHKKNTGVGSTTTVCVIMH